jgi:molecular chaperone DnaK (HSP70)
VIGDVCVGARPICTYSHIFFPSSHSTMATVIGIDLGTQSVILGQAKRGGVDVMNNESSQRLTP